MNMAIVPFLISTSMLNFFDLGGLIEEINFIFIVNLFLMPIIDLFIEPDVWVKKFKRHRLYKFLRTGKGYIYNQRQANQIVEGLDFVISEPYAFTFSTLGAALFYLPIFPLGIIYALISLIICYWTYKWILVSRCHKKVHYGANLSRKLAEEFELCIVFYSLGLIMEENVSRIVNNQNSWSISPLKIFCLALSLFVYLFDTHKLLKPYVKQVEPPKLNFEGMTKLDQNHYELTNPATEHISKKKRGFDDLNPVL